MRYDWLKKKGKEDFKDPKYWSHDEWLDEISATVDPDRLFIYGEIIADSETMTEAEKFELLDRIHRAIRQSYGRE